MKKLICIPLCALLLCASCGNIITDDQPPLSETGVPPDAGNPATPDIDETPDRDGVYLEISGEKFAVGDKIAYTYVNNTDSAVNILSIPRLEKKTQAGWDAVPFCDGVGFCGTPDSIASSSRSLEWELDVDALYGAALDSGTYRLSLEVVDDDYEPVDIIFAEFIVL